MATPAVAVPSPFTPGATHSPTTPRPTTTTTIPLPSLDDAAITPRSNPQTPTLASTSSISHSQFDTPVTSTELAQAPTTAPQEQDRIELSTPVSAPADHEATLPPEPSTPVPQMIHSPRDVDMADAVDPPAGDDASDNESGTSDSPHPSKKKKGQRFFCTDFPPCALSFTRSEHLARHIRKHTGERPFQCHCSRRFSRLDNLRQHAQTVHVNEEIPGDSLAAQGTRFQKHTRTDRIRPASVRSRSNTLNTNGGHSRGHSRNLSASSIASTASSITLGEESRKRPPPLAMASSDPASRARLSLDTYNAGMGNVGPAYGPYAPSPTGYSTPASTAYSNDMGSPRFGSAIASPVSSVFRPSGYSGSGHSRRLSVPTAPSPFIQVGFPTYPPPFYGAPMQANAMPPNAMPPNVMPQNGMPVFAPSGYFMASPTTSIYSHGRRESESELEYRRRTWHPGTYPNYAQRPATSGLSYHQTPDDNQPAASEQPAASQMTRLPGIESFDHAARLQPSPMMVDSNSRPNSSGRVTEVSAPSTTRLDVPVASAPQDGSWQVAPAHIPIASVPQYCPPPTQSVPPPAPQRQSDTPVTPRRNKRQAWYGGPVGPAATQASPASASHRPSPEESGSSDDVPTPSTSQGNEYHPVIAPAHGPPEHLYHQAPAPGAEQAAMGFPQPAQMQPQNKVHIRPATAPQTYALYAGLDPALASTNPAGYPMIPSNEPAATHVPTQHDMGRLNALVAVATSETRAAERS